METEKELNASLTITSQGEHTYLNCNGDAWAALTLAVYAVARIAVDIATSDAFAKNRSARDFFMEIIETILKTALGMAYIAETRGRS